MLLYELIAAICFAMSGSRTPPNGGVPLSDVGVVLVRVAVVVNMRDAGRARCGNHPYHYVRPAAFDDGKSAQGRKNVSFEGNLYRRIPASGPTSSESERANRSR